MPEDISNAAVRDDGELLARLAARARPGIMAVLKTARNGGQDIIDDVVQAALVQAFRHHGFDPAMPGAVVWLRTTALRIALSHLRSRDSAWVSLDVLNVALRDGGSRISHSHHGTVADPLGEAIRKERIEVIRESLKRVKPELSEVLVRFYLVAEGTQAEIAAAMGLTVPAFNSRLNRARLELKAQLEAMKTESWRP